MSDAEKLVLIREVYGPSADIYADVLRVPRTATPAEIREAFFCLRYDAYRKLEEALAAASAADGGGGGGSGSGRRRKEAEARMDAIAAGFHLVGDPARRAAYDAHLAAKTTTTATTTTTMTTTTTDEMGFPVVSSSALPPSHHRTAGPGRPSSGQVVEGGLNARAKPSPLLLGPPLSSSGRQSPSWTDFDGDDDRRSSFPPRRPHPPPPPPIPQRGGRLGSRYGALDRKGDGYSERKAAVVAQAGSPTGVDDLDRGRGGRRGKDPDDDEEIDGAIDDDSRRHDPPGHVRGEASRIDSRAPSPASRMLNAANTRAAALRARRNAALGRIATTGPNDEEEDGQEGEGGDEEDEEEDTAAASRTVNGTAASLTRRTEDDNDARANGDDCTYDEEDSYNDETTMGDTYADDTTMGDTYGDDMTIGESTWASHDASSYATREEDPARFSPRHKQGNMPEPILKSSGNKTAHGAKGGRRRSESDGGAGGRRVTIHSHRGRGEDHDQDFSLFEMGVCPIPSLKVIQEEVNGTYKDLTRTWHQVTGAFVITTDDIDRVSDKIRDAKIELGENYARQVLERSASPSPDPPMAAQKKKRQVKKTSAV